ncbi:uncharacterized protein METZ01_LOCUS93702 [marine metagenome]|uniref:Uncharacterized protein n=1 Tax=marine metagenome TaxID=408172 RepID=A0A381VM50_9ZZZZ
MVGNIFVLSVSLTDTNTHPLVGRGFEAAN